ncbi:MAG: hypothetical protein JKY46_00660 [Robiginitomaculum sp.]|nr:hypothetical protein [Robiginitomaculum sp.]
MTSNKTPAFQPIEITPYFSVATQVFPEHLSVIRKMEFGRILNVRPDNEEDCDEQLPGFLLEPLVIETGLQYSHIPVISGADFPEIAIRAMAHLLSAKPQKTLAFCLTGIRSLRLWALASALAGQSEPEQIQQYAKNAGFELSQFSHHLQRLAKAQAPIYVTDDIANMI